MWTKTNKNHKNMWDFVDNPQKQSYNTLVMLNFLFNEMRLKWQNLIRLEFKEQIVYRS